MFTLKVQSLQEENAILRDKNSKLKEITAGLLGKQLNIKDARIGLLTADLEEKERDLQELRKTQTELMKMKDEEIKYLHSQLPNRSRRTSATEITDHKQLQQLELQTDTSISNSHSLQHI